VKTAPIETTLAGAKSPETLRTAHLTKDGKWRSFPKVPNLLQYIRTGTYFARTKVKRKTIRLSLDTDVFTTAKQRLPDKLRLIRKPRPVLGTFGQAREQYATDLDQDHTIGEGTRYYRQNCLKALTKTWPGLDSLPLRKITVQACKEWAHRFAATYDEQYFNNTLGTVRAVLARGGVSRDDNPAFTVKRLGVKRKQLQLPEMDEFDKIIEAVEGAGAPQSQQCADLVRFLAYSGCRISEAHKVTWPDVDWQRKEIRIHNAKRSRTSSENMVRFVPIIPAMQELLLRLQARYAQIERLLLEHRPDLKNRVCLIGECEKSLTAACKKVGAKRITHHDLRHLFATRCIESGVDIPTVSRWLGHLDGGALAMKVYGHLRREHSAAMAQRVSFARVPAAQNIVQFNLDLQKGGAA
jgi:integrase